LRRKSESSCKCVFDFSYHRALLQLIAYLALKRTPTKQLWQVCGPVGEIILVPVDVFQVKKGLSGKSQQVFEALPGRPSFLRQPHEKCAQRLDERRHCHSF
jgi:hypothetical protein